MLFTKIIPATNEVQNIRHINFFIEEKRALVYITTSDNIDRPRVVEIDLTDELANATATQLTIIKGFFKKVVAMAYEVDISELPDTIFEPNV